jgi:hypothetical protein
VALGLVLAAVTADALKLDNVASFALSAIFNLQYWQGASDELGGPEPVWNAVAEPSRVTTMLRQTPALATKSGRA